MGQGGGGDREGGGGTCTAMSRVVIIQPLISHAGKEGCVGFSASPGCVVSTRIDRHDIHELLSWSSSLPCVAS